MISDRRYENHFIPIDFKAKETFQQYPFPNYLTLTVVTDGRWNFVLNDIEFNLPAPFILCLNDADRFLLKSQMKAAAKTFVFDPTFLNSSLTKEAIHNHSFNQIEDLHDNNLLQIFLQRNCNYCGLLTLDAPTSMQLNTWLSVIGSECLSQSDGKWTCRIRRYLLQILYLLEDAFLSCYERQTSQKSPIDHAIEYIHSNYHLGLSLEGISTYVGLNRTTLNKQCKEKTGLTIIQYLKYYRTKMAEEALCHTNLNLNEIAICCGYNYESYFIKIFTEKHGLTPTEYRKQTWNKE